MGEFGTGVVNPNLTNEIIVRTDTNKFVNGGYGIFITDNNEVYITQNQTFVKLQTNIKVKMVVDESHSDNGIGTVLSVDGQLYNINKELQMALITPMVNEVALLEPIKLAFGIVMVTNSGALYRLNSRNYRQDIHYTYNFVVNQSYFGNNNITKVISGMSPHSGVILTNGSLLMWGNNERMSNKQILTMRRL